MGCYTFRWEHPADEVFVTGTFDDWSKGIKLEKANGVFTKTAELPKAKVRYKFVVDGNWVTNDTLPIEDDGNYNYNNILLPEDITEAPVNTLAGAIPKPAGLYGISAEHQIYSDSSEVPYQVINSLGNGTLGIVDEVHIPPSKESFVRKRVQIPYSTRVQRLRIVQQEAAVLKSLTHMHIIKILSTYQDSSTTGQHFYSLLISPVGDNDLRGFLDIMGEK